MFEEFVGKYRDILEGKNKVFGKDFKEKCLGILN
jgi:hypothetical protein